MRLQFGLFVIWPWQTKFSEAHWQLFGKALNPLDFTTTPATEAAKVSGDHA
jgi:hypothetical protein